MDKNINFSNLPNVEWWLYYINKRPCKKGLIVDGKKLNWKQVKEKYGKTKTAITNRTKTSECAWPLNIALFVPSFNSQEAKACWKLKVYNYIRYLESLQTFSVRAVTCLAWSPNANKDIELTYTDYK